MGKWLHPQLIVFSYSGVLPVVMCNSGALTISKHLVELLVQLKRVRCKTGRTRPRSCRAHWSWALNYARPSPRRKIAAQEWVRVVDLSPERGDGHTKLFGFQKTSSGLLKKENIEHVILSQWLCQIKLHYKTKITEDNQALI